jgi:hypothetical protein
MNSCLHCGSERVVTGMLIGYGKGGAVVFRPDNMRDLALTFAGGTELGAQSYACRDCGLVWNLADKDKLNTFLKKHCKGFDED